jgi:aminoglycoside phosphotransferase
MSITKTSKQNNKLINEIKWFINLPKELKNFIPSIYDYSLNKESAYIKMEYLKSLTLHEAFVFGNLPKHQWEIILLKLRDFRKHTITLNLNEIINSRKKMYLTKTIERLEIFRKQNLIDFSKPIMVNQVEYESLDNHISYLKTIIEDELLKENEEFNIIHGDFCISNILYDPQNNEIKLIDPRGTFGEVEMYGDYLYEWGKLAHSIDGLYDFIISDKFSLIQEKNNISYRTHHFELHVKIKEFFYEKIVPSKDKEKIKLIQALIFFSMLPLHKDYSNRQYIMLAKALELINPFIKNKKYDKIRKSYSS